MATNATVRRVTTPAGDPAWLVSDYDDVKALLADPRLGRSHPEPERAARYSEAAIFGGPMGGSPSSERSHHALMRRLLAPSFSARRMASLRPRIQELVDGLLEEMGRRTPPVDFHAVLSFPLPALVICELLGVPYEDREAFRRWSDDAADMTDGARSRAGLARLHAYMRELLAHKRQQPAEDVLCDLIAAHQHAPDLFTDDHVVGLAAALLFAGHETTVAAIDKGVLRPNGRLLVLEHVRAQDPGLATWQDRVTPLWKTIGGGCHPNRNTRATIEAAGFELESVEEFMEKRIPVAIVQPQLIGTARKAERAA